MLRCGTTKTGGDISDWNVFFTVLTQVIICSLSCLSFLKKPFSFFLTLARKRLFRYNFHYDINIVVSLLFTLNRS